MQRLFVVTDQVPYSLRSVLDEAESGKIDLRETDIVKLMYNALCALNYLHSTGLMHRRITPSNLHVGADNSI